MFMQTPLSGIFENQAFVIKGEEEHLCSAQGPNQSHLTRLFLCELSCESGWRVWGHSECGSRLLLALIGAVPLNHVAQLTAFTGSI